MSSTSTYKNLSQRNYYKIFSGTNQTDGYEKIHLGYEASTFEINFKKDKTTYFHIPFFANRQFVTLSTLVADGAIPGPIPAMADRIFKKQAGYGKNTPWGNTSEIPFGNWLCTWLYADPSGRPIWLDRYFDPGRLSITEALEYDTNVYEYVKNNPVIYDVSSQMTFESGVWYQYFHQGEKTGQDIVSTFAGISRNRLRFEVENWEQNTQDKSIYKNNVFIKNFESNFTKDIQEPGFSDRSVLDFTNNSFLNCFVPYNSSYNLLNEFSLQCWVYNNDWTTAPFTQLVGNIGLGGYGIFYNNLKAYPCFAIPETTYGHLFYINQNIDVYTEKNIQRDAQTYVKPIFSGLNSDFETVLVDLLAKKVYKYNHLGDILAQSKLSSGSFYTLIGEPKTAIIDGSNNTHVITTSGTYIFNQDLILTQSNNSTPYKTNEIPVFNTLGQLVREQNVLDVKFDNSNNKWTIRTNNNVYRNNIEFSYPGVNATNLAIDPNGDIWILADINDVYIYDADTLNLKKQFKIGVNSLPNNKTITFVYEYNRENNTKNWYAIFVLSNEKILYQTTLEGNIIKTIFIPDKLNQQYPLTINEDSQKLTFNCKGDFTGYEWKRIFNKVLYDNIPQIQFKIAADQPISGFYPSRFTLSAPTNNLTGGTWYLVTCTFKNNEMKIFINDQLYNTRKIPDHYDLLNIYQTALFIGTPGGKIENLNFETGTTSLIWDGYIDTVRIYDYALETFDTQNSFNTNTNTTINTKLQAFIRAKMLAQDMIWSIPTSPLEYIDTIERFFKHRLPGSKSPFFKVKLSGLQITDPTIRAQIENEIKTIIAQTRPAYTRLLGIEWVD